ncbi:MAG: SemiSWEET transporter [Urechidicola sp.]|nr:SemiSWEET transporter [Urechidicola sp.]
MSFNVEIIGLLAATLTTASFVPQVLKVWRTKEVKNLSLTMYSAMLAGVILWFTYGVLINSISIILANIITAILVSCIIYFRIRYSKK